MITLEPASSSYKINLTCLQIDSEYATKVLSTVICLIFFRYIFVLFIACLIVQLLDEEEDEVEDFSAGLITEEDVDVSEKRDLSYWHITIPRIESIFERNKKVRLYFQKCFRNDY